MVFTKSRQNIATKILQTEISQQKYRNTIKITQDKNTAEAYHIIYLTFLEYVQYQKRYITILGIADTYLIDKKFCLQFGFYVA